MPMLAPPQSLTLGPGTLALRTCFHATHMQKTGFAGKERRAGSPAAPGPPGGPLFGHCWFHVYGGMGSTSKLRDKVYSPFGAWPIDKQHNFGVSIAVASLVSGSPWGIWGAKERVARSTSMGATAYR